MKSLDEIMRDKKCFKSTLDKAYTIEYEKIFEPIRDKHLNILEIGWGANGESCKGWLEYFPNAQITMADKYNFAPPKGVNKIILDQGNIYSLFAVPNGLDIIIDDGSHKSLHIIQTMGFLYHMLKPGGYYIIEDLDCKRANTARKLISKDWDTFKKGWEEARLIKDMLFIGKVW